MSCVGVFYVMFGPFDFFPCSQERLTYLAYQSWLWSNLRNVISETRSEHNIILRNEIIQCK